MGARLGLMDVAVPEAVAPAAAVVAVVDLDDLLLPHADATSVSTAMPARTLRKTAPSAETKWMDRMDPGHYGHPTG